MGLAQNAFCSDFILNLYRFPEMLFGFCAGGGNVFQYKSNILGHGAQSDRRGFIHDPQIALPQAVLTNGIPVSPVGFNSCPQRLLQGR